uniref:Ig-like domain-containing protein n=1 Tax=Leptobrachium leishanense TaxID=445787 RepID=A0A8C5QPN0_9ANUR
MNVACFLCALLTAAASHAVRVSVEEGEAVTLKCRFPGHAEADMQWVTPRGFTAFFNQHKGLRDMRFELRRFSQNRLNIGLSNITLEDEGIYSCLRYGDPVQRQDVNVTVLAAPSPPVLGFTCSDASSVTLSCSTRGSKPPPRITWLIDNRTEVYGNSHVRLERNGKTCEASSVLRVNSFSPNSRATCIVRHRTLHPAGFMAASFTFQDLNPATVTEPATISTDPVVLTARPIVTDPVALTAQPIVTDPVALTAQPIVTDPVALTAQPIVTDPVALTARPIVTDPVALTAQPIVTDPVALTAQPIVTDPVALTAQPIVTDPVALTARPIVTDPVALTARPIVTDPVALTAQPIVTDPVALTAQPIVTDPVALTDRATVTELVTLLEVCGFSEC